jgi:SsrA-binding protein
MSDILASNDKARYDYELLEKVEAGLVLSGQEVKSAKTGHMKLKGAHVAFTRGEAMLLGAHIASYPKAGPLPDYDPDRSRKLLLHKKEVNRLRGKREEDGLTIVPIRAYIKGGRIKVELAVARGKKQYEKRETIKKRDLEREARGRMKIRR